MKIIEYRVYVGLFLGMMPAIVSALEQKRFVIIIPSYNNIRWYEKNIASALEQDYSNYRIIYIDDCSPDGTGNAVADYLHNNDHSGRTKLIRNEKRVGALANLYRAIFSCDDEEIIVTLDGDDWFPDNAVLSYLNKVYQKQHIWLTYGQFQFYPESAASAHGVHGSAGFAVPYPDEIIKERDFRLYKRWLATHLRTFRAWLFKKIKLKDLLHEGYFYAMAWDTAFMWPMLEMAGDRFKCVSRILYIYNCSNPISDWQVNGGYQQELTEEIRKKSKYPLLAKERISKKDNDTVDLIVHATEKEHLIAFLKSVAKYVSGINSIHVVDKHGSLLKYIQKIAEASKMPLIYVDKKYAESEDSLKRYILRLKTDYIIVAHDLDTFTENIKCKKYAAYLSTTKALRFYFKNLFASAANYGFYCRSLFEDINVIQFNKPQRKLRNPSLLDNSGYMCACKKYLSTPFYDDIVLFCKQNKMS